MGKSKILYAAVSESALDVAEAMAAVETPECGAVAIFSGVVRNHDKGLAVSSLRYSAHPDAGRVIAEIAGDVAQRYNDVSIWVAHRIGLLRICDSALVAAAASAHRKEALGAVADLVELVKARLPVWKEQEFVDGNTQWVGIRD